MLDPNEGVGVESPATDVEQESSPETHEETPSPKVESAKEVPFNEHPRWKERQQELERTRQEAEYWRQQAQGNLEIAKTSRRQEPVQEEDPYAGMTVEEKAFFERVDRVAEKKALKIVNEKEEVFRKELNHTRGMTAEMVYKNFLKDNPDVIPNSPEEKQIAQLVSGGYPLEHAKKIVMFDSNARREVQKTKEKTTEKTKQKIEANLERNTTPSVSAIPRKEKLSVRDIFEETSKKLGFG